MACRRSAVRSRYAPPSVSNRNVKSPSLVQQACLYTIDLAGSFCALRSTNKGLIATSIAATHREIRSTESHKLCPSKLFSSHPLQAVSAKNWSRALQPMTPLLYAPVFFSDDKAEGLLKLGADEVVKFDLSD